MCSHAGGKNLELHLLSILTDKLGLYNYILTFYIVVNIVLPIRRVKNHEDQAEK